MAEQHSQTADYENRYKFTGHELDRETGLYHAEARYYDPKISIWLSTDPLLEKYPNWNPYNYVMQNPINLIDPTGMGPEEVENDDITIRGKNVQTGEMEPAIIVKTSAVNITIDIENLPLLASHDPISNKPCSFKPIVVEGVDNQLKAIEMTLGQADALTVNLGAGIVAGGGISGGLTFAAMLTGTDSGGVFTYSTDAPTATIGLSAGGGIEIGAVFATPSSASSFNRYTLEGYSLNLAGGYGPLTGTVSMGVAGKFDWTPTTFSGSVGTGYSSFKVGGSASITNMVLQGVIRQPIK
jgi:RHS repeat-associated protein